MTDSEVTSMIEASKKLRRNFLERICEKMYDASQSSPTNKVPWGYVSNISKEIETGYDLKEKLKRSDGNPFDPIDKLII